jgi:YVTN family beta-propeller protein
MKKHKAILGLVICMVILGAGCQPAQKPVAKKPKIVYYPPSPDIPRLQFLKSISSTKDLDQQEETVSGWEAFIVGAEEEKIDAISKPYGIAFDEGKLYVGDVNSKVVRVVDFKNNTFGYLTRDRRLANPVNIHVNNGFKYVADNMAARIFVFGQDDQLKKVLGKDLGIKPIDLAVRDNKCYVADMASNQVVVIDIYTDKELLRMGTVGDGPGGIALIAGLALDADENVYVTDKALARVTKFDKEGVFQMTFGEMGDSIYDFARPKGIALDRAGRMWIVDAAPQVTKIYNPEGQLMMYFGYPGAYPGCMNLPVTVLIDYDHVDLFRDYFAEGAQIEYLVLVANQYGPKINVYGFGKFPNEEKRRKDQSQLDFELQPPAESQSESPSVEDLQ